MLTITTTTTTTIAVVITKKYQNISDYALNVR
jgi:hypothetical protein